MIDIVRAIILGIIEGLTEFLPISSTGHLIVGEDLLGYKDTAEIFTVVIQMGAIAAVIWFYRQDIWSKISGFFGGDVVARRFIYNIILAVAPALLVGFLLKDRLGDFATVKTVAISLIIGGVLIWLIETFHKTKKSPKGGAELDKLTSRQALLVGLYQILALIPGVSRSGSTIMGGLLSGMDRVTATAFSFYLSIPVILLAGGYQLVNGRNELHTVGGGSLALLVGTVVSFITAFAAIKWLLKFVSHHDFKPFAYYRIIFGIILLLFIV